MNDEHFYLWLDAGEIALEIDSKGAFLGQSFHLIIKTIPMNWKLVGTMGKTDQYWKRKSFEFSISILEKQWWHDAEQQGDNWYTSDWFGSLPATIVDGFFTRPFIGHMLNWIHPGIMALVGAL